jgi:hypothetical protein
MRNARAGQRLAPEALDGSCIGQELRPQQLERDRALEASSSAFHTSPMPPRPRRSISR